MPGKWDRWRWSLVVVAVVAGAAVLAYALVLRHWAGSTTYGNIEFHDAAKAALDNKLATSRSSVQAALIVGGALWALLIAKKDEARISPRDTPEVLLFAFASVILAASLGAGFLYSEEITSVCSSAVSSQGEADAGAGAKKDDAKSKLIIPDVFGPRLNSLYVLQNGFLVVGVLAAVFTVFSAHRLKEDFS